MAHLLIEDCGYNLLGHAKACWKYDYPTGSTLENAIFQGLRPFYPNAQLLGSPSTIVDVGRDNVAYDNKGCKVLGHINKKVRSSNNDNNIFVKQDIPGVGVIQVRIPRSIITQVRRPKVNLRDFKGSPKHALNEQIKDYHQFAMKTTAKDGYEELFSIVLLYGIDEKKGVKSIFLTIEEFHIPEIVAYEIGTKKNGTPCAYHGLNEKGQIVFSLSSFNKGSSNFYKRFVTSQGILMSWAVENEEPVIYTRDELLKTCAIQTVVHSPESA